MELFPPDLRARLLASGEIRRTAIDNPDDRDAFDRALDLRPLVKIYMNTPRRVWLFTDLDPLFPDYAFGIVDLGAGATLVDSVPIRAFTFGRTTLGLSIERDENFVADKTLYEYAVDAYLRGRLDDPSQPRCAETITQPTEVTARASASHLVSTLETVEQELRERQMRQRLDDWLRQTVEGNVPDAGKDD